MNNDSINAKSWDVTVSVKTTMSAIIPVSGDTKEQAEEAALSRNFLKANAHRFSVNPEDFNNGFESPIIENSKPHEAEFDYSKHQMKLLDIASKAYEPDTMDRLDLSVPQLPGGCSSDGLASFLSNEFKDVLKGESDNNSALALINALNMARHQLLDIVEALEEHIE